MSRKELQWSCHADIKRPPGYEWETLAAVFAIVIRVSPQVDLQSVFVSHLRCTESILHHSQLKLRSRISTGASERHQRKISRSWSHLLVRVINLFPKGQVHVIHLPLDLIWFNIYNWMQNYVQEFSGMLNISLQRAKQAGLGPAAHSPAWTVTSAAGAFSYAFNLTWDLEPDLHG